MLKPRRNRQRISLPWEGQLLRLRDTLSSRRPRAVLAAAIVLGVVVLVGKKIETRSKVRETWAAIHRVEQALYTFRIEHDKCPGSISELVSGESKDDLSLTEIPRDGWGRELKIVCPKQTGDEPGIVVMSAGPSGSFLVDDNLY